MATETESRSSAEIEQEPEQPEQFVLADYLHKDEIHDEMWKGNKAHFPGPTAAALARMDKALDAVHAGTSLLAADERGLASARMAGGDEVYTGLGEFYRGGLFHAQEVLLSEVLYQVQLLRDRADQGLVAP